MKQRRKHRWLKDWVLPIGAAMVVTFGLRTYVASANVVPSASMYPTIPSVSDKDSCVIFVNKLAVEFGQINRGEVVVFHFPDDPSELFVKRVVGMPGDEVKVTSDSVYINGKKLDESNTNIAKSNGINVGTYQVPPEHYFMLGDNRPSSADSRVWNDKYVSRSAIIGEAKYVIYPFDKIRSISESLSSAKADK